MKISPIKFYNNLSSGHASRRQFAFQGLSEDVFEKSAKAGNHTVPFGVDKANIEETKGLEYPYEKYKHLEYEIYDIALDSAYTGMWLKNYYDEKYGENGYVFLSVGTSPAGAAKAMEYMGADVRYLPISDIRHVDIEDKSQIDKYMKKEYKDFLNSIGITKEKIEKDDKHYIIADYVCYGKTLKNMNFIMNKWLGIDKTKYTCENIKKVLEKYYKMAGYPDGREATKDYLNYCYFGKIGLYCGIPHLPYDKLNEIEDKLKAEKTEKTKCLEYVISYYLNKLNAV